MLVGGGVKLSLIGALVKGMLSGMLFFLLDAGYSFITALGSGWAPAPVNAPAALAALRVTWRRRGGLPSSNYSVRGSGWGGGLSLAAATNAIIGVSF